MIFIFTFILTLSLYAAPKEIEVWFISNSKTAVLEDLLNRPQYIYQNATVELQCQEMGEYCFDPQYGLYKKNDMNAEIVDSKVIQKEGPQIPSAKSVERELINCDSRNFFDIFCGQSRSQSQTAPKLDLWIDTSSSMREFDFTQNDGSCHRKSMVKMLDQECGFNQKVNIMMFDTSIKQAGNLDQLCNNHGLNDYKRLMDWIERSDSKKLVVITDIYEFHKEFADFIDEKNGKLRGDKEPLTAKQLLELADLLAKSCK